MNFDTLTFDEASSILSRISIPREGEHSRFALCDHWQNGEGWIGPLPDNLPNQSALLRAEIAREFVFHDVIGEIVWRAAAALKARPLRYGAALERVLDEGELPTETEEQIIGEMDALILEWASSSTRCGFFDAANRMQTADLRVFLGRAVTQLAATGRASIRAFIPPAQLEEQYPLDAFTTVVNDAGNVMEVFDEGGNRLKPELVVPLVPLWDALSRVHFEMPQLSNAGVWTSRASMRPLGVCKWQGDDGKTSIETSWVDDQGQTHLRVMNGDGESETTFDLNGELMHLQLHCDGLIKESLVSQQKDINRRLTMSGRSSNLAGFPERVLLGAELQGKEVDDPANPGHKKFVPDDIEVGPGRFNNFKAEVIEGADGEYLGTTASALDYKRLDPIDTTMFDSSVDAARARMLGEAHQAHALIAGDATASGESRKQARDEFVLSLADLKNEATRALVWILDVAFGLALETTSDNRARFYGFKWTGDVPIHAGPRPTDERVQDLAAVKASVLSRETAMARDGIDDIDAERGRVGSERTPATALQAGSTDERNTLSTALRLDGVPDEIRWKMVWGLDDEQLIAAKEAKKAAMFGDGH